MADECNRNMNIVTSKMRSSSRDLGFCPQKELVYNKLLPYADRIDEESQMFLVTIKENLGRAVMLREIKPGCIFWSNTLYDYIMLYGMKFSKYDHIAFVKLMYELVTIPNLDPNHINTFGSTLVLLLKKKELIRPDELELPWRPLYELIRPFQSSTLSMIGIRRQPSMKNMLRCMVHAVKPYFPVNATQEILDEVRPKFCPFDDYTMYISIETSEFFLPLQLFPEHHSIGYQLWFDEFMTMWKVCHNSPQWEENLMWLMARLANHNIGYINWEPHLPIMFTRFMRCLNLPVLFKQIQSGRNHKLDTTPIAIWIVAVLGNGSNAQMYLEKFLRTIETYFYPANFGRWIAKLKELFIKLPSHFISRLHREKYAKPTWETPIPDNYKLTDSDIDAFVKSIMPVAMTAMFNKFSVNDACQALQQLATMRPNLVIPNILERMYSTFDSLTEPHKLTASMVCMAAVARPMVQGSRNINKGYTYPEGPTHVLPLLFSCLPGIDPNDIGKCLATFRLISVYATLIPFVDSSRSTATMTEEERMICEATSRFEDFILQFLDRMFIFIDSSSLEHVRLESRDNDLKSKMESIAESAISRVCTILLIKTSDTIFENALHKLRSFITERVFETKVAGQLAAVLCRSFSRSNGRETLRALVPVLAQTILPADNEREDLLKEENLDNRLLHAMLILSTIVDTPGNSLLPHMDTLMEVLDYVLLLTSVQGNNLACNLLKYILSSLSTVTPYQYTCADRDLNDPDYPYIRDWGESVDIDNIQVKWYVPGEEEIALIQKMFSRYLTVQLNKLKDYCEDPSALTREKLFICLNTICSMIRGSDSVLPVWTEEPLELVKSSLKWEPLIPTYGLKKFVTMTDGSNVRQFIAEVMTKVQQVMLENAEDDTKSFFVLIRIWTSLLIGKIRLREAHERRRKSFQMAKKMFEDKLIGNKSRMAPIILERCDIQQETYALSQWVPATETHKRIMLQLFSLAISRYADVRSKAQSSLFSAIKYLSYSYTLIIPHLIDILAKDTDEHHDAFKGTLYMLFGSQNPIVRIQHWSMLRLLWPAIILSKPSEKLSVIRLKENIVDTINKYFSTTIIELEEIPDRCLTAARALWEHHPRPILSPPNEDEIQNGVQNLKQFNESNLAAYTGLLDELLRCILEESLHWRHRLMAMNFIQDLVHPDQIFSAKIVRYFLQALVHDSLEERKLAIRIVAIMLKQQKRKHPKVKVDISNLAKDDTLDEEGQSQNIVPGMRADNSWLQYSHKTCPQTCEQWDEPRYVHQHYVGYYVWPKTLEVYAPSSQQPTLDPEVRQLTDCEKEIDLFFNDPQNVKKLISYLSLEEKKGKDKFNIYRCLLFKGLFRNHGIVYMKHFLPHVQKLVTEKYESSQRCVAEFVAGIVRGAKHWPYQMTCDMWQAILPILRTALSNLTEETIMDWGICFATAQQHRDPNKYHWLLECLMEEPPLGNSEPSFVECGRLYMLQNVLIQQLWRLTEILQRLLVRLEDRLLTNPFQNVRDRLGAILATVFEVDIRFPNRWSGATTLQVQTLIDKIVPRLQQLIEDGDTANRSSNREKEESLSEKVANVSFDETKEDSLSCTKVLNTEEQEVPRRLLKTVCKWIVDSVSCSQYGITPGFYQIFPVICQLVNFEADEELSKSCVCALANLAQAFTMLDDMPVVLTAVKTISEHTSWSVKFTSLEFLQVLVFHNMGIILSNVSWVDCVVSIVLHLLEDERLEVREKASQVLGGLLHCTFIEDQEKLLEEFKKKAKTRLHKKNGPKDASKSAKIDAIRLRHAGVLGLCAFIRAHPYDVPKYVPSIFDHLGLHMNDPQPIPMTIRKTLNDFKRTHYDGWTGMNGHAQHFTEEQLTLLQDLVVPPSHYA